MFVIFFFKQKTAYEMRMSDWSSDVCSSDLEFLGVVLILMMAGEMLIMAVVMVMFMMNPAGLNPMRSEEHTSELQSLMRISYAVFCLKKKKQIEQPTLTITPTGLSFHTGDNTVEANTKYTNNTTASIT